MRNMRARIYQPTREELDALWPTFGRNDKLVIAARAILADVNLAFSRFTERIRVYDPLTGGISLLLAGQPPQCTCLQWRERPLTLPRGRRHCPHTLAWDGYVTILRRHYDQQAMVQTPANYSTLAINARSSFHDLMAFAQALHRNPPTVPQAVTQTVPPGVPAWIAAARQSAPSLPKEQVSGTP
jgi:hypothetical protein